MVKAGGWRVRKCSTASFAERCRTDLPAEVYAMLQGLVEQIGQLTQAIAGYEEKIAELARQHYAKETARLEQVKGVGTLTALSFVLTLGDQQRFAHSRDVGCYFGLRPRQRQSGERDPQLGISKAGDNLVRRLLVQSAHYILGRFGPATALRQWGLRLAERGGKNAKKRAIVAVARKLAVLLHRLWVSGEAYDPQRNAMPAGVAAA
jgi:transposase